MRFKPYLALLSSILLLSMVSTAWAEQKCGGVDIANGPFTYIALDVTQATFNGNSAESVTTYFGVTAPSVANQSNLPDIFPGEGNSNLCSDKAYAVISAMEIYKVGDENGDPITPLKLDPTLGLGLQIASAFSISPLDHTFDLTDSESMTALVSVFVGNPMVDINDYGDYEVKLAAKAPGFGIGVGKGISFLLSLRAATATDTTPPVITVTKPSGDEILGEILMEVQAYDPDIPPLASGLASISATVSSAGGTVSSAVLLMLDSELPVPAGVMITGSGAFIPIGGSGVLGQVTNQFTSEFPSGIGSYRIDAQAKDSAGNTGYASRSF